MNQIITKHNLDFFSRPATVQLQLEEGIIWNDFIVGTCGGRWAATDEAYLLLAIVNSVPGNGHLDDVFQWFEHSARRDKKALKILEFFNPRFKQHCIKKRGFRPTGKNDLIKYF